MAEERKKSDQVTQPAHVAAAKSATSQRRHQLESNTLAAQLKKIGQALKEGPSRTTWIVCVLVVAAIGIYFVWRYFSRISDEKNSARWYVALRLFDGEAITPPQDEKALGLSPREEFAKFVADKANEGTMPARAVRLNLARMTLAENESRLGSDQRADALTKVREAKDLFEKLQGEFTDLPVLHQEVILSTGKAYEMLGEFGKAVDQYKLLGKDYPKSEFLKEAKAGEERLKEGSDSRKEQEALQAALNRKSGQ